MATEVFHPVLNTVQITAVASRNGRVRENVFHYNYASITPSPGDIQVVLEDLAGSLFGLTGVPTVTCEGTWWTELRGLDIDHEGGASYNLSVNIPGQHTGQAMNGNCSMCLTKRTGMSGRSNRGRWYLFDLSENMFDDDTLNVIYIPFLTIIGNHMLAKRLDGLWFPAVASRVHENSRLIEAITFDYVADSQRRRLKGRGI